MKKLAWMLVPLMLGTNAALADNWTGPYGALGVTHADLSVAGLDAGSDTLFSLIGGARMGMDNGMVLGLEADYSNTTLGSGYLGTMRGVVGVQLLAGSGMLFATLGYAYPDDFANPDPDSEFIANFSGGVAVGVGFESKFTEQMSLRVDVTDNRIGFTENDPDFGEKIRLDLVTARAAVAWQF